MMTPQMFRVSLIVVGLYSLCFLLLQSARVSLHGQSHQREHVILDMIPADTLEAKRSASSPVLQRLQLDLKRKAKPPIRLNLRQIVPTFNQFPVYRLRNGEIVPVQLPDLALMSALYKDDDIEGLFRVKMWPSSEKEPLSLNGHFIHDGKFMEVRSEGNISQPTHFIYWGYQIDDEEESNFEGDMVEPPEEPVFPTVTQNYSQPSTNQGQAVINRYIELAIAIDYAVYQW